MKRTRMLEWTLLLVLLIVTLVVSCSSAGPSTTITVTVVEMTFVARSGNVPDVVDVEFDDGSHIYVPLSQSRRFKEGHQYVVVLASDGDLVSVTER